MKETVFQGLEYTAASACAPGNGYTNRIDQTIEDHPEAHGTPSPAILKAALGSCTTALLSALPATGPLGQPMPAPARECLAGAVVTRTRSALFDQTIAGSLRHPDEARRALQESGETLGRPCTPYQRAVAVAAAERAARSELRRTLVEAFLSGGRFELFASVRPNETPEAFCASRTNYASQWFDEVPTTALRNPGDSLAYFRARDSIQAFSQSLCVQLQSTSPTRRGFTREELERAIIQRIPD